MAMSADTTENTGPDLTQGVSLADFGDQPLLYGHVGDEPVILARTGDEITAVGARCTHYQSVRAAHITAAHWKKD